MKYKKKPIVVEAFRMGIDPRPNWFQSEVVKNRIITDLTDDEINDGNPWNHKKTCCIIKTLEGEMRGDYGDYIIQGVQGEIYPCKPDIFDATYEVAEKAKEGKTMTELEKQQSSNTKREIELERENIKAKIQGILVNSSQTSSIGWAVGEDDFETVAEKIVRHCFMHSVSNCKHEKENLRSLLDKASRALTCFVDLRGMTAAELKSAHNGICILLSATKMLDAIKAGLEEEGEK